MRLVVIAEAVVQPRKLFSCLGTLLGTSPITCTEEVSSDSHNEVVHDPEDVPVEGVSPSWQRRMTIQRLAPAVFRFNDGRYPPVNEVDFIERVVPLDDHLLSRLSEFWSAAAEELPFVLPPDHSRVQLARDFFTAVGIGEETWLVEFLGIRKTGLPQHLYIWQYPEHGTKSRFFLYDARLEQLSEIERKAPDGLPWHDFCHDVRKQCATRYVEEDSRLPGLAEFSDNFQEVLSYQAEYLDKMPRIIWKLFSPEKIGYNLTPLKFEARRRRPPVSVHASGAEEVGWGRPQWIDMLKQLQQQAPDPERIADLRIDDLHFRSKLGALLVNNAMKTALTKKTTHLVHHVTDQTILRSTFFQKDDPQPPDEVQAYHGRHEDFVALKASPRSPTGQFDDSQVRALEETRLWRWFKNVEKRGPPPWGGDFWFD